MWGENSASPGVREARAVTLLPPLPGVTLSLRIWLRSLLELEGNRETAEGFPSAQTQYQLRFFCSINHEQLGLLVFSLYVYFLQMCGIHAYMQIHMCACVWRSEVDIC